MTYLEIDKAMVDITRKMCVECKARLDAIPNENRTEKKAVKLEHGIYTFCGNAGELFNTGWEREKVIDVRRRFVNKILQKYQVLNHTYQILDDETKTHFVAALHAELYLRDQWLNKKEAELAAANASGDTKSVFELTIQLGAVKNMFAAWEAWRIENNIFPYLFEGDRE